MAIQAILPDVVSLRVAPTTRLNVLSSRLVAVHFLVRVVTGGADERTRALSEACRLQQAVSGMVDFEPVSGGRAI
jgi:hypothetical protein